MRMKILVTKNKEEASQKAFKLLQTDIINGAQVLGLATGSSPLGLYQKMTNSPVDYSNLISINLDEYVGLKPTDPQSYHYFMEHHLFTQKPFAKSFIPDGSNLNATKVINHYNQILATYPIDTQILGIGNNGHIGFNEPGTPFDSQTHKVKLTPATINANARFFTSSKTCQRKPTRWELVQSCKQNISSYSHLVSKKQTQSTKWSTVKSQPLFQHQSSKNIQT